jgi:hypothetical protein
MTLSARHHLPVLIAFLSLTSLLQGQLVPMPGPPGPDDGSSFPPVLGPTGNAPMQPQDDVSKPTQAGEPDLERKRDPFWPVGHLPRKPVAFSSTPATGPSSPADPDPSKLRQPDWDAAKKLLDIRGVSLIGRDKQANTQKYLAMIGGRLVEAGDTVSVTFDYQVYRWKITEIKADGISLVKMEVRPE